MNRLKKLAAAFLSLCCLLSFTACGEGTADVMTINGHTIRAGIYIYYCIDAYYDAIAVLSDQGVDFNSAKTNDDIKKLVEDVQIDAVSSEEWIQNKATEYCLQYVAVLEEFDRLELELTEDELAEIETYRDSNWATLGEFYTEYGIGEQSVEDVLEFEQKKTKVYQHYYGNDGEKGVTEDELRDYYIENNARVKYVKMSLTDGEGNLLKADGKKKMMDMAEDFLARLEAAEDEEAMLREFDYVIEDYKNYATSLSAAAVTTTDAEGNTVTTATTTTTARSTASTTTTTTTTTADAEGTDASSVSGSDETTTTSTETTTTTTTTTTAAEETKEGETTTTTTTTTTNPYANESIIAKMTTTEATEKAENNADESEMAATTTTAVTYTPSEKTYNFIFNDAEIGKPEIIEEDENYYIVVRLDIEDRMNEDDLWTESQMESVRSTLYSEDFEDMVEEWAKNYSEERNDRAYKRYDPFDLDLMAYTDALYSSYYNYY